MTIEALEQGLLQILVEYGIRAAIAILVILLGRYLAQRFRDAVIKLLHRPEVDKALGPGVERIIRQAVYFGVLLLSVIVALIALGVPAAAVLSISGTVIILLGIALRESLSNLVATVTIIFFGTYHLGEDIETKGKTGTVREIQPFNTVLLMGDKG
jgi:small conductance mechanosensitive channel